MTSLPVSIDLSLVNLSISSSFRHLQDPLVVSVPHSICTDTSVSSVSCLLGRLQRIGLPCHWINATKVSCSTLDNMTLCKLSTLTSHSVAVMFTVTVSSMFHWTVSVATNISRFLDNKGILSSLPRTFSSVCHIFQLLTLLESTKLCPSNPEQKFLNSASQLQQSSSSGM